MIPKECKRLAEVDFPVAEVSRHSAREKSIRHGHPSTLHLWWARRPLAACRAMLMALLLPDPCDMHCPAEFKEEARRLLKPMPNCGPTGTNKELRDGLLKFIADFANWDNSAKPAYLECARGLVRAAHGQEPPLVVDPFAGGGSIPLEALRIGCDAFASDLNPVACLILKVLLEDIPRHGPGLADELRRVGKQIKEAAEKELAGFYPPDPDGARPIAYLWARTVRCEAVGCGAEIPLMRSFWLCKKANRRRALKLVHERDPKHPKDPLNTLKSEKGTWRFEIYEPKSESEVRGGTVARGNGTCPWCNTVLPVPRVRAQLAAERGGADVIFDAKGRRTGGARLLAVVTLDEDRAGRQYRLAAERDYESVWKAQKRLKMILDEWERNGRKSLCPVPDEAIALTEIRRVSVPLYGASTWGDLFTSRQKISLATYASLVRKVSPGVLQRFCALAVDRLVMQLSAHCRWKSTGESLIDMFGRHAIGMVWDFAEPSPGVNAQGIFSGWVEQYTEFVRLLAPLLLVPAHVGQGDAAQAPLPNEACGIWFTDPPYYDSIPYAHLADCFYVWLKRCFLGGENARLFSTYLSTKDGECVVDRPHTLSKSNKHERYFESKVGQAGSEGRRLLSEDGVGGVVFAHKTTEGWEALLSGITQGGWSISASWPITTELSTRLNARDTASLAASVHLVCRPRPENAGIGGWEEIVRELPNRIGDWMERLSGEGIRGADLVFSCIGPALELFSKFEKVETAEGDEVGLGPNPEARTESAKRGFLSYVWEVVGRTALQQILGTAEAKARNSAAGALEEDARLTALFLWTLQSTDKGFTTEGTENTEEEPDEDSEASAPSVVKGFSLLYDVVRRFAQPLGIHLENWEGRIIETKKGTVRLIPVLERRVHLFGEAGTEAVARAIERSHGESPQFALFPDQERVPDTPIKGRKGSRGRSAPIHRGTDERRSETAATGRAPREATTLDRVHIAMSLQAGGQATALRAMLEAETQRSPDFLRLANALSALYPKDSEEKRLLDAMLLGVRS